MTQFSHFLRELLHCTDDVMGAMSSLCWDIEDTTRVHILFSGVHAVIVSSEVGDCVTISGHLSQYVSMMKRHRHKKIAKPAHFT